jgi:SPP1 family predicted phage head-tail adaptor
MNAPIRSGDLRESVTIQAPSEQTNAYGESILTWAPFASRRASVRNLRTDELMSAQGPYSVATHEVQFRYVSGLSTSMRLIWVSRFPNQTLDIVSISSHNRREYQTLVVKEQVE